MASPNVYYPGGSSGARLATRDPLFHSGSIWYVSTSGTDGVSPAGRQRTAPLLTIAQAITNASAGDTIQLIGGGTYSISSALAMSKAGVHLISEGSVLTRATIAITSAADAITASAAGVWIENITFAAPSASAGSHIAVTAANCEITDCSFTCNSNLSVYSVNLGAGSSSARLKGCTFTGTGTSIAARPARALRINSAISDVVLDTVVFDGGTYGWSDYAFLASSAVTRLTGIDVDFLNDSDIQVATGSIYKFHRRNASGSSRVEFTA